MTREEQRAKEIEKILTPVCNELVEKHGGNEACKYCKHKELCAEYEKLEV